MRFTGEHPDAPYIIHIYPGEDADFEIYEDAGDGYDYELGAFATYRLHWDDSKRVFSISNRRGSYKGMVKERQMIVKLLDGTEKTFHIKEKR